MSDLSPEVRAKLDAHLDAVEEALLRAGRSREERRAVVDDLEAQLLDMLAQRSASPQPADVDAVLGLLDPPEAYAGVARPATPPPSPPTPSPAPPPAPRVEPVVSRSMPPAASPTSVPPTRSFFMKPSVLVALIVCGTLLVMTPVLCDQLRAYEAAHVLAQRTDLNSFSFGIVGDIEGPTRFGFWLTGSLSILTGAVGGFIAFAAEHKR